ncbi:hypothetical protein COCCADRAFT_707 [Bipolaris zeicola 26-R-13]|uniref:Uncharacterized protein n=1 Tax=Cochliobolus carbonum (strain 26-R-13) TaxID=930089 RepID=W6YTI8_COCC2|nr:uncharacterized protein COCCADRAFT_707 [Bipolaris zeicola 26-R-13]EUC38709.1 hypothetical protein COCCADRAFT_707 [Bipolaris zeicola 26-R-13]
MDDIIFSQPASQPAQSQAPQSPHKPASSKDVAVPTTPSKSLASRPKNSAIPRSPRPHLPSTPPAPPEDHTFLPATRHALEQALGKASLGRHEVLLQQDKEHTQDYIAQLQDAVKQKNGITPSTHEALLRREVTMWKAKAQEMDESAKTEMQLLRECNGRMEEEMIALRAVAEGLRREGEGLKEEVERLSKENEAFKRENDGLKADMQKGPREEDEERMLLITDLEGDKEEMQRLLDEVMDQNEGLKGEVKNLKDEAKKLKEEVKMLRGVAKEQGGGGGEGKNSKDDKVEKRKIKNIKRRERDRKRRDQVLVKENMQLAAKLAEVEKQKSDTSEEGLEAEDEVWEGFQDSDEGGEMVQEKDDARSAERSKSKKSKKKNRGKKGKKVIKEER